MSALIVDSSIRAYAEVRNTLIQYLNVLNFNLTNLIATCPRFHKQLFAGWGRTNGKSCSSMHISTPTYANLGGLGSFRSSQIASDAL